VRKVAHARKRNPLSDLKKILRGGRYPQRNHLCKFWWRSVKGFKGSGGSKFALFHWLWSSPLQHSRTTVRVCDSDWLQWKDLFSSYASSMTKNISQLSPLQAQYSSILDQSQGLLLYNKFHCFLTMDTATASTYCDYSQIDGQDYQTIVSIICIHG